MATEQLRTVHQAQPFRPFVVHLADGRALNVLHSEFLAMSPTGRTFIIYHPDETFSILDRLLVTEIEVLGSPSGASRPS